MADLTANTYHRLPKAYQYAVTLWLFEHGIDGLNCSHLTMDEGRFDAHMYEYDDSAEHPDSPNIITQLVNNVIRWETSDEAIRLMNILRHEATRLDRHLANPKHAWNRVDEPRT